MDMTAVLATEQTSCAFTNGGAGTILCLTVAGTEGGRHTEALFLEPEA